MKKKILVVSLCVLSVLSCLCGLYLKDENVNEIIRETQNIISNEIEKEDVIISNETRILAENTIEAVENGEKIETIEAVESTIAEEETLEQDAVVDQQNITYNGDNEGKGLNLLGAYKGLTYYSQADSRWANKLYTSTNNKTQTIKSSGCGPTSAAMIVSSSKGAILPTTMAKLAIDNGYRTTSSGTAWSYFSFVADYFNFDEYYTTANFNTAIDYLKQKENNGASKYFIVTSCGNGLFTTGGHYIVLASLNDETIRVLDPYLYSGKFDTSSRKKANVKISDNNVYVTKANFKKYANYKQFWIFSNDQGKGNTKTIKKYIRYVNVSSSLNVRKSAGTNYKVVDKLENGVKVTVYETKGNWSKIGTNRWVATKYLSTVKNTVGQTKQLKFKCILYSQSSLKGRKYTYKNNTKIKILKNINSNVDYVKVISTGRKAYINKKYYK